LSTFLFDLTVLRSGHRALLDISDSASLSLDTRKTYSFQFVTLLWGHCGPLSPARVHNYALVM